MSEQATPICQQHADALQSVADKMEATRNVEMIMCAATVRFCAEKLLAEISALVNDVHQPELCREEMNKLRESVEEVRSQRDMLLRSIVSEVSGPAVCSRSLLESIQTTKGAGRLTPDGLLMHHQEVVGLVVSASEHVYKMAEKDAEIIRLKTKQGGET